MKSEIKHKGYWAYIEFCEVENIYFGKVADIEDLISFEGNSPEEAQRAFTEAVDDYIEGL